MIVPGDVVKLVDGFPYYFYVVVSVIDHLRVVSISAKKGYEYSIRIKDVTKITSPKIIHLTLLKYYENIILPEK